MKNKEQYFLFLGSFIILFAGMGLFPILPVYGAQFGASSTEAGLYLTIIYVALSAGSFLPGWLAGRVSGKTLFVAAGAAGIPALALMGQVTAFWPLVLLTTVVWFSGGINLALISVYTGQAAHEAERGKSFSLLVLATPLGALIGGVTVGVVILLTALHVWHFWVAATLLLVSRCVSEAVSSALVTDLLPPASLAKGLPWLNGVVRAGGIISFVGAGAVIDHFGVMALYGVTAALALMAIVQLGWLNGRSAPAADCGPMVPDCAPA